MFKNTSGQKITFLVIDISTNAPKTGDAANLTAYVSKDDGAVTVLGDTSATEKDATNAPGLYDFDVTQTESNADKLVFSGKSSTANVRVVPVTLYTRAPNINRLGVDSSGNLSGSVASVVGAIGSLGATAKSDVNAEVLDVLNVDTFGESSAVPAATASIFTKIRWLATLARNKITETATTQTLRNDADNATIATATVSDDGTTTTRGEWT